MRVFKTEGSNLKYKWQADEMIEVYSFCYDLMEYTYNNWNEHWELPYNFESYDSHFNKVIVQIETHLTYIQMNLFQYPSYSLSQYYELLHIYEIFEFIMEYINENKFTATIRKLSKEKIKPSLSHLNEYERFVLIYMKSIVHYGVYYYFKSHGFDPYGLEEKLKKAKSYLKLVNRDISKIYANLSEDPKNINNEAIRIVFNGNNEMKKAIIYFHRINNSILENGIFKEREMFINFIKCLESGFLDRELVFEFNTNYLKKVIVKIIDLANPFFRNNARIGEYYFIKNSNQFKYGNSIIKAANWDAASNDNLSIDTIDGQFLKAAELEYINLKNSFKVDVDPIYNAL